MSESRFLAAWALRRARAPQYEANAVYDDGSLRIDSAQRRVTVDGSDVELTPTEFRLLETLASQTDRVISYRELLTTVWGPEYVNDIDFLRVYVWRLRKKLEKPGGSRWLSTERGFGYRLKRRQP